MISGADISTCKKYRYSLWRSWAFPKRSKYCCFIMLNPSTADGKKDDPTIRRCINLSKKWGYSGLFVVNLFAYRSTDSNKLKKVRDPVGNVNDIVILTVARDAGIVVCAWGNKGILNGRDTEVISMLYDNKIKTYALSVTKDGNPNHPLHLPDDVRPKIFKPWKPKRATK